MSKATTITLANDIALGLGDTDQLGAYYADLVRLLGNEPMLTNAQAIETVDVGEYEEQTPTEAISLLAVYVDDQELTQVTERELEAVDANWRLATPATPRVFTLDDLSENVFDLYPPVDYITGPVEPLFDDAFGAGFVTGQISIIYTEERENVPEWLELWLAIAILDREFLRESNHRDLPMAASASELAAVIKKMIS